VLAIKSEVEKYWDNQPCGTGLVKSAPYSFKFFVDMALIRYELEPFILKYSQPERWRGKRVLEVGCGAGVDLVSFALAGADVSAIDLSSKSIELAKKNLKAFYCHGDVRVANAEKLPFGDNMFDFVHSWGVLHHMVHTVEAINEIKRVLKPGGKVCVMLYNKNSIVSMQMYLRYGVLKGNPMAKIEELYAKYHESPGTKVYTKQEALTLFDGWHGIQIHNEITPYDLRYTRYKFLPMFFAKFVPKGYGFFHVINAYK
jgi:ubiquinone/menaquinone biosynthesis C-methylase UbiE